MFKHCEMKGAIPNVVARVYCSSANLHCDNLYSRISAPKSYSISEVLVHCGCSGVLSAIVYCSGTKFYSIGVPD